MSHQHWPLLLLLLALLARPALPVAAESPAPTGLSSPTPARPLSAITALGGSVRGDPLIAGDRVIYMADFDDEHRVDLYSVPLAGGPPLRLSQTLPAGQVEAFDVTSTGSIVFSHRADETWAVSPNYGQVRLYRVPVSGGALTAILASYPSHDASLPGGTGLDFTLTPDGSRVIYRVDYEQAERFELFSAPLAGGASVRLNTPLGPFSPGASIRAEYRLTPDGSRVLYLLSEPPFESLDLYVVPAAGGSPVLLDAAAHSYDPAQLQITPDGRRAVYLAANPVGEAPLSSVALDGGVPQTLAAGPVYRFGLASDGARVVFEAGPGTPEVAGELRSVPVTGGPSVLISADLDRRSRAAVFVPGPAGDIFFTRQAAPGLYRAPASGGSPALVMAGEVDLDSLRFTADGQRALFRNGFGVSLHSYPLAGGAAVRIDDPAVSVGEIRGPYLPQQGGRAVYAVNAGGFQLYSVPLTGGPSLKLSGSLGAGEQVAEVAVSGQTAVFAIQGAAPRLMRVSVDGSSAASELAVSRARSGDVTWFEVSVRDGRAVYIADQERDEVFQLYSAPLGEGPPIRLSGDLAPGARVEWFRISPAGGRVIYEARQAGDLSAELYSVAMGGGAPVSLSEAVQGSRPVRSGEFTPDGAHVFFQVLPAAGGLAPLYRTPVAGGSVVKLADGVGSYLLTPDSAWAIYTTGSNLGQLRSVRVLDGRQVELGTRSNRWSLTITPDSARVVYMAADLLGTPTGLVSQPVGGGPQQVIVTGSGPSGWTVTASDIVYSVRQAGATSKLWNYTLFYRPFGGAERLLFSAANAPSFSYNVFADKGWVIINAGGRLSSVRISDGAVRTLFADAGVEGRVSLSEQGDVYFVYNRGLYRVPVAGGAAVRLAEGLEYSYDYSVGPDGEVLYIAEGDLLALGPEGGTPVQLNQPAPAGQQVEWFILEGDIVLYLAGSGYVATESGGSSVQELFLVRLEAQGERPFTAYLPLLRR